MHVEFAQNRTSNALVLHQTGLHKIARLALNKSLVAPHGSKIDSYYVFVVNPTHSLWVMGLFTFHS